MKRTNKNLAAVTMAATMACGAFAVGGTTIGDWQGTNDGWFDWSASGGGSSPTNNPGAAPSQDWPSALYGYSSTTGVTLGTQSLKMTAQSGYSQNLSIKTEYETDSEGNGEVADFLNNTELTFQVAYNANEWAAGSYSAIYMGFNASGAGYGNLGKSYGQPSNDTGNSNDPGGYDPTDYASPGTGGITTRTITFNYANLLPGGTASMESNGSGTWSNTVTATPSSGYVEFLMATINGDNSQTFNGGNFYISNAQFTNTPVNTSWTAMAAPQGNPYNWGSINNFTPYSESTLSGGMPCNAGDTVTFGTSIPTGITETVDLNANQDFQITVGTLIFDNANSNYVIAQGTGGSFSVLNLNGNVYNPSGTTTTGTATIADELGSHTISAPIALGTNTNVAVGTTSGVLTLSGVISGAGGLTLTGVTQATMVGTVVVSGSNTYSGGTTVTGGTLLVEPTSTPATTSALPTGGALTISGGLVQLATGVTAGSQSANPPLTKPTSSVNVSSLAISGSGTLDITNNHIIVNYSGLSTDPIIGSIAAWIKSGYNGNTWTGAGITSSIAASNLGKYGIGYAASSDSGNPAGLSSGQIEIKYTLLGDANLDGKVNGTDFTILATNFNQSVTAGWDKGDFNYDGKINGSDFLLLAGNFNQSASGSAVAGDDLAAVDAFAAANGMSLSPTSVPEPASMGLLAAAGLGMLSRRRRSAL
jgi:autotransporter-associated beta strand protein